MMFRVLMATCLMLLMAAESVNAFLCDLDTNEGCLNGGVCVARGSYNLCDCSKTVDTRLATRYVGQRCDIRVEHPTGFCSDSAHLTGVAFCVNNGTCRPPQALDFPTRPCLCPSAFHGLHCEFENGNDGITDNLEATGSADGGNDGWVHGIGYPAVLVVGVLLGACIRRNKKGDVVFAFSSNGRHID